MNKRIHLLLAMIGALLIAVVIPASADATGNTPTPSSDCSSYIYPTHYNGGGGGNDSSDDCCEDGDSSSGGNHWRYGGGGDSSDDSGSDCDDVFDADKQVRYKCPDGYTGPNANNVCRKVTQETFPATPNSEFSCPDGYEGPDADNNCTRTTDDVFPATPNSEFSCPAGYSGPGSDDMCTKTTTETFPATPNSEFSCPDGYEGPNADGNCTRTTDDVFPATPVLEYVCPDGYEGPRSDNTCTKGEVVIDTVHVDEGVEYVCVEGFDLGTDAAGNPVCTGETLVLIEVPADTAQTAVCPADYVGPDADGNCTKVSSATKPASSTTTLVCPTGFDGPNAQDECTKDFDDTEYKGVVITTTVVCPTNYTLDAGECIRPFPVSVVDTCPDGYILDDTVDPPVCVASDVIPAIPEAFCEAPLRGPVPGIASDEVCLEVIDPTTNIEVACPDGYEGPDNMNLCVRTVPGTMTVDAVPVTTLSCDDGYLGPDANGDCLKLSSETIPAEVVETAVCPAGALGPQPDGKCFEIGTEPIVVPAISRAVFTCPDGYEGPDADWNCTKMIDVIDVVDATEEIVGYECPAGTVGPDADNNCTATSTEEVPAIETITFTCPAGTEGPDADNNCTRKTIDKVPAIKQVTYTCPAGSVGPDSNKQCRRPKPKPVDCTIKFYDFPHANKFLFSESRTGSWNLDGHLAHFNNDVESVKVPHGCTVSVSKSFNGSGWCYSLGAGIHNLPDDEMSWFAIPATGCNTNGHPDPTPTPRPTDCTIKFYDFPHANKFLFSESRTGSWNLDGHLAHFNNDVESVKVPHGCTVSVSRSFNASGWCYDLGEGVHNLPDDEMSWFSTARRCH